MKRRVLSMLLLTAIITSSAACGAEPVEDNKPEDTKPDRIEDTSVTEEFVYPYPETGFGGQTVTVLSRDDIWGFMCHIDAESLGGDVIDDAQYMRNRLVESKFDIILEETQHESDWNGAATVTMVVKSFMADEHTYDIMFLPLNRCGDAIRQNCFYNLLDIDSFHFDEDWWYDTYNDAVTLNGAMYGAMGGAQLMVQDAIRMLGFNKNMMTDLKLELPYDIVREGKWTFDVFNEYLSAAANLNGDSTPEFNPDGNTVYGLANHGNQFFPFMMGCGEFAIEKVDDMIVDTSASDRWYKVLDKLTSVMTTADAKVIHANNATGATYEDGNYSDIFFRERSLFSFREFMHLRLDAMRNLEFEFGILPFPKFDESQEQYYTNTYEGALSVFLPTTLSEEDAEKIGAIVDALAYEGEKTVVPEYRGNAIEQKGLRDEDSIEMANIIADSIVPSVYRLFDIGVSMIDSLENSLEVNDGKAASIYASHQSKIESAIAKVMEGWGN